jgi:hypothetical protein
MQLSVLQIKNGFVLTKEKCLNMNIQHKLLVLCLAILLFLTIRDCNINYTKEKVTNNIEKTVEKTVEKTTANIKKTALEDIQVVRSGTDYVEYTKILCTEFNVPFILVDGIIWNESNWLPYVTPNINTNGTIDIGFFQLNSGSIDDILMLINNNTLNMYIPIENLKIGVMYLSYWMRYWEKVGYTGVNLTSMVISSFSQPTLTLEGYINWNYISLIRNNKGWDF